ncbi:MAG: GNAT family protein [Candidatus Saganbacteria bacterium]|nr:GNAT family protein [Candidatus Saganbacteria bacterium]
MILETKRSVLREFQESDFEAVHKYASDPEVVRYMEFGPNTEKDTRQFLQMRMQRQIEKPRRVYDFALVLKEGDQLIGSCGIVITQPEHIEASLGYILNKDNWNQGLITEASRKIVQFAFQDLGVHRVFATCDPANIASYSVMGKIGMKREGHLREHKFAKGKWRDSLIYSILEHEFTFT